MNPDSSDGSRIPRLRDRLREQTLAVILAAAEQIFAQQGHGSARMEDIAARAGIATGTLYNYFDDRNALLAALAHERGTELLTQVDAALATVRRRGPADHVLALYAAMLGFVDRRRDFVQVLLQNEVPFAKGGTPFAPTMEQMRDRVRKVLEAGRRAGVLRKDEHGVLTGLFFGAFRGVVIRALREGGDEPLAPLAPLLLDHFMHGASR